MHCTCSVYNHIWSILRHMATQRYDHNPKIWPYSHMAFCHFVSELGRYGYLLKAQYICSNLAKELTWLDYYTRNESKNKILWNFTLYIFPNPFIKKLCLGEPQALRLHKLFLMLCNPEGMHHRIRYLLNHFLTKRGECDTLVSYCIKQNF